MGEGERKKEIECIECQLFCIKLNMEMKYFSLLLDRVDPFSSHFVTYFCTIDIVLNSLNNGNG